MPRSMADGDRDTYRARIEWRWRNRNPYYVYGRPEGADNPRFLEQKEDAPTYVSCYGPYATKGVATQALKRESRGDSKKVISAKIQKASTTWEDIVD